MMALAWVACYVLGAVPFGWLTAKLLKGIDIREVGSGNIGATNVYRTLGPGPGIAVFALDTLKGLVAVLLCEKLGLTDWLVVVGALLAVVGHSYSVFLRLKGGKAVATSLGVIIGLSPPVAAIIFPLWVILVFVTRYVSVASIIAAVSVAILMFTAVYMGIDNPPLSYKIMGLLSGLAIITKHRSNIGRLMAGTEPKVGRKPETEKEDVRTSE